MEEYAYLWNEEKDSWVLIDSEYGWCIFNLDTRIALYISDDAVFDAVVDKLLAEGARRYSSLEEADADRK